jgi:hypothetical protein
MMLLASVGELLTTTRCAEEVDRFSHWPDSGQTKLPFRQLSSWSLYLKRSEQACALLLWPNASRLHAANMHLVAVHPLVS